jgi:hypothetical protein
VATSALDTVTTVTLLTLEVIVTVPPTAVVVIVMSLETILVEVTITEVMTLDH